MPLKARGLANSGTLCVGVCECVQFACSDETTIYKILVYDKLANCQLLIIFLMLAVMVAQGSTGPAEHLI